MECKESQLRNAVQALYASPNRLFLVLEGWLASCLTLDDVIIR